MLPRSKKKFTIKIIVSYLTLGFLVLVAGYFIYAEFKDYTEAQNKQDGSAKLIKINSLLTEVYEAENLSKLALQHRKRQNILAYSNKVDSVSITIDALKLLLKNDSKIFKLDSIQQLLKQKTINNAELRKLKGLDKNYAPLDSLLQVFNQMEINMGRITPEAFVPDFDLLPFETQESIREYVSILNENIPENELGKVSSNDADSILGLSKSIVQEAKTQNVKLERSMMAKELQVYKTDLELSQKLRSFISAFEQEIIAEIHSENRNRQTLLKRSSTLAWTAAILGFLLVCFFTFLIANDYWKSQSYRTQLEKEKSYSDILLKSRGQLISTVSHDLRSPLNSIKGYLELMEQHALTPKQQEYISNMQSSTSYVEDLANDLLDFSRLESGKIKTVNSPFILSDLIKDTVSSFKQVQNSDSILLEIDIAETLEHPINGDSQKIRQILTNLIGNAFKFTNEGSISIKAFTKKVNGVDKAIIQVIDTGIGIPAEKQLLIFQEFTQVEGSSQGNVGGYGLGLTISKKLTELLGGTIEVKSEFNKGSAFTFSIPLKFSNHPSQVEKVKKTNLKGNLSLAILDDDESLLKLLKEVCKINGISVKTFSSFEALQKNLPEHYDMVLTDIQMPKTSGFEVVKAFKKGNLPNYKGQPVIAMTGSKEFPQIHYLEIGFDDVLFKPFSTSNFLNALVKAGKPFDFTKNGIDRPHQPSSALFSTENLAAFVENEQALFEILHTFLKNTDKNLLLLSKAIKKRKYHKVREVSHKMLPMFRQLKIESAICLLENFEHIAPDISTKKAFKDLELLENSISKLKKEMNAHMTKLSVDSN
ncbi:hybrid sensor histidine kinase/response regulator [uncultured Allomuricauda sp.]|uniref:hybrid sensor histidine kinase/response regulator n=1 Tax=Flagellimonas sp. W118 TaxID=3410791 RepID=UPI002627686F|nr:hybrid sensor histidine kinase/response regulator [uncultured Allomuricauda sp.]